MFPWLVTVQIFNKDDKCIKEETLEVYAPTLYEAEKTGEKLAGTICKKMKNGDFWRVTKIV